MKNLLFALFLMSYGMLYAQESEELSFSQVIMSKDSLSKNNLYSLLRSFVTDYYHDSKSVLQMEDKEAGIIIGKASSIFDPKSIFISAYEGWLDYSFKIQIKDGRYKISLYSFFHHNIIGHQKKANLGLLNTAEQYTDKGMQKKYHNKVWIMLKDKAKEISFDFFNKAKAYVDSNSSAININEDNW